MDRFEHIMVEFYWSHPAYVDPAVFKPSFTVFHADGRQESQEGGNREVLAAINRLGGEGWRVASSVTTSNWILWTLERRLG